MQVFPISSREFGEIPAARSAQPPRPKPSIRPTRALGNQSGATSITPVKPRCIKPWVIPNFDPMYPLIQPGANNLPTTPESRWIDPPPRHDTGRSWDKRHRGGNILVGPELRTRKSWVLRNSYLVHGSGKFPAGDRRKGPQICSITRVRSELRFSPFLLVRPAINMRKQLRAATSRRITLAAFQITVIRSI